MLLLNWPKSGSLFFFIVFAVLDIIFVCTDDVSADEKEVEESKYAFDTSQGIPLDNINRFSVADNQELSNKEGALWLNVDTNGYILYCPCMGRFGNQAEQLIGSLAFAKGLNRTLVLPPWIIYPQRIPFQSEQIDFSKWFSVEPLQEYHKVMEMKEFMTTLAPAIWPKGKRNGYCYVFRDVNKCTMKEGNPFGPFWDHFGVNFDAYFDHPELLWNSNEKNVADKWKTMFPSSQHMVLAFQGAPGDYPSKKENQNIQKYIKFSDYINEVSDEYIKVEMNGEPYVAIHLRNGGDMASVCSEVKNQKIQQIFCSSQCTGYLNERKLIHEMCAPSKKNIIKTVKKYLEKAKAKRLFIGTDNDAMLREFRKELKSMKVTLHRSEPLDEDDGPITDIAIMSKADYFIGNCVSSFSAFVRRQRNMAGKPVTFFGLD